MPESAEVAEAGGASRSKTTYNPWPRTSTTATRCEGMLIDDAIAVLMERAVCASSLFEAAAARVKLSSTRTAFGRRDGRKSEGRNILALEAAAVAAAALALVADDAGSIRL